MHYEPSNALLEKDALTPDGKETDAGEEFCPTCGYSFKPVVGAFTPRMDIPRPILWPWLLILLGMFLIAMNVADMVSLNPVIQATREPQLDEIPANLSLALIAVYQNDLNNIRDLIVVGGIMVLAGISVIGRAQVQYRRSVSPGAINSFLQTLLDLWAMGETLLVSCAVVTLAIAAYVILTHLLIGIPLSWRSLAEVRWQLREIIAVVIFLAQSNPVLPPGWTT